MRIIAAACLVAISGMLAGAPARADWVPAFKGNDTGGIIAWEYARQIDFRGLATDHCAQYDKVPKFVSADPHALLNSLILDCRVFVTRTGVCFARKRFGEGLT